MSNSKPQRPFDDICCRYDELTNNENELLESFAEYVMNSGDIQMKISEMKEQNARMKKQLEEALRHKQQLQQQVTNATQLLKSEKSENKRTQQLRERLRQKIDNITNHVMDADISPRLKNAVSQTIENYQKSSRITYTSDSSSVACSETDSDSWHLFPDRPSRWSVCSSTLPSFRSSTSESHENSVTFFAEIWETITNRSHNYKSKTLVLGETCTVCELRLQCGTTGYKCSSCRAIVHEKCKNQLPKPCVPTKVVNRHSTDLADFCPVDKPMIPGIVFHSILYIEANGLNQPTSYVLPVYDLNVKKLHERFLKGRGVPNLSKFQVPIVGAFLKNFFASLNPSLIPASHFQKLVKFARINLEKNPSYDELMEDILQLPQPNRDTLACLILHLKKIANTPNSKMNSYMLSKTFTPILVENFNSKTFSEEKIQRKVIQRFIDMPEEFWKKILLDSLL